MVGWTILLGLVGPARAYELSPGVTDALPAPAVGLAAADLDGDGVDDLVVAHDAGVRVLTSDGATLDLAAAPTALALADLAGDGAAELLLCTEDGLGALRPVADAGVVMLTSRACAAVVSADLDGDPPADVATAGTAVLLWQASGDGGLSGPVDAGIRLTGEPLLAPLQGAVAAGEQGSTSFVVLDLESDETADAGGALGALAAQDGEPAWTLPEEGLLVLPDGAIAVGAGAGALAAGDLEQDGVPEILVVTDEALVLVSGGAVRATTPFAGGDCRAVVMADLDGDGCPDAAVACGDALTLLDGRDCDWPSPDVDGDGFALADGDCDDADPDTYPDAVERCDGRDNDCDGEADEPDPTLEAPETTGPEGGSLEIAGSLSGCYDHTIWFKEGDSTSADCREEGDGLVFACDLVDEGTVEVILRVYGDDEGETDAASVVLKVANTAPRIVDAPEGTTAYLDQDAVVAIRMRAYDQGALDTLTWSVEGGPPGMVISADGLVEYTPAEADLGTWTVEAVVADDAGATDRASFWLSVEEEAPDDSSSVGCCCFGATAGILLPMLSLGLRRRRRVV